MELPFLKRVFDSEESARLERQNQSARELGVLAAKHDAERETGGPTEPPKNLSKPQLKAWEAGYNSALGNNQTQQRNERPKT